MIQESLSIAQADYDPFPNISSLFSYFMWMFRVLYYLMFKKCRENQCLGRETIDFLARQFSLLKELARTCPSTEPQLVADQISESAHLMEKRILFLLDDKPTEEFHDYVSDFYEDKLERMRKELGREMGLRREAEAKAEEANKVIRTREEQAVRGRTVDFSVVSETAALRQELGRSQQLIAYNQEVMEEQHRMLEDLQTYVAKMEEREAQLRARVEAKVRELDEAITAKQRAVGTIVKEVENERKKREKEWRELQLLNVGLLEEKDRLESQLVIKVQQTKLLSKKVYDQSLVINKFERAIDQSEGVLLQEKIENNRAVDLNKALRERLRTLEQQYEAKLAQKVREIKELESKLIVFSSSREEMETTYSKNQAAIQKLTLQLKAKVEAIKRLEQEVAAGEAKSRELERECRRLQRKEKESTVRLQELTHLLQEKEEEAGNYKQAVFRSKKEIEGVNELQKREKQTMRAEIEAEFNRLVSLNRQVLEALQTKEKQIATLTSNHQEAEGRIRQLNQQVTTLSESFEDARLKVGRVEEQRRDLDYVREQLEIKLKHSERKCEDLQRLKEERQSLAAKCQQLEEVAIQTRKILKEKETQAEKLRKVIQEENNKRGLGEQQEAKALREEAGRKEFKLRELTAKVRELQEQLRDTVRHHQIERQNMAAKIKQLQGIINQQSDRTDKMDSSI